MSTTDEKPKGYYEPDSISKESVMERLLPCPFCGEKPEFNFQAEGPPEHGPNAYWGHSISHNCLDSNINMHVRSKTGGRQETPDEVISLWNTRHNAD